MSRRQFTEPAAKKSLLLVRINGGARVVKYHQKKKIKEIKINKYFLKKKKKKIHDCLHSVEIQPGGLFGGGGGCGCSPRSVHSASPQASMGLETMLFGVSGSCDDMDATSLPVELEPGPPSEKLTCGDMKQTSEAWTEQSRGGAAAAQERRLLHC